MDFDKRLKQHKDGVKTYLEIISMLLNARALTHDNSKSSDEEYMDFIKPTLDKGLKHHYENNRHHPEFFDKGIDDMNLIDIIEMITDWCISIKQNGKDLYKEIQYNFDKYNVSEQLKKIIINTYKYIDDLIDEE